MKKKMLIILAVVCLITAFTGCRETDLGDTYVEGCDYQYMYANVWNMITQQKGSNGQFIWDEHYIYYLDAASGQCVPLCNKADCLHNKETDVDKAAKCNAYINRTFDMGAKLTYADGYVYIVDVLSDEETLEDYYVLYRIKEDGSAKEQVYKWGEEQISDYCIHRNVMYYIERIFIEDEGQDSVEAKEEYHVKRLNLSGIKQPVLIYEPEEELEVYTVDKIQAYGNHVYFMIDASRNIDGVKITDDNYMEYMYFKYWNYDIQTKKLEELTLPDMEEHAYVSGIAFWQNQLVIMPYLSGADYETEITIYTAELDGSSPEELLTAKQGYDYLSDGTYLYECNYWMVEAGIEPELVFNVYDEKMNAVDVLKTPFRNMGNFSFGHPEGLYYMKEREDDSGCIIMYLDKRTIGTYQGASFEKKAIPVAEYDYSIWDNEIKAGE